MPFFLLLLFLFVGCAHHSKQLKTAQNPQFYLDKAIHYKKKGDYPKALEFLRALRKHFFYSSLNSPALLLTADIYFEQEKFSQAGKTYQKHLDIYPQKLKDYALYRKGLAEKNQLPQRVDQDLSIAESALKAFNTLLQSPSDSPYKQKALKEKKEILNKKASRELKTALFFKKQGWLKASLRRIQYFIEHYPQSPLLPKALLTGAELAYFLKEDPKKWTDPLIKNHPESSEAKNIPKSWEKSTLQKWGEKLL